MLLFLAGVLEQMDLALEHISKREVHDARFGLMLTDNAVELMLHQIAKDRASRIKAFQHLERDYPHKDELAQALGRSFEAKVKFARVEGNLSDEHARTIGLLHTYRNEVYHVGLQHEAILLDLAELYFDTACRFFESYKPRGLGWGSSQKLPERSKKYFKGTSGMPGSFGDFEDGCRVLARACAYEPGATASALADHMDRIVNDQDIYIGIVAEGVYLRDRQTRDEAVVGSQAWAIAFTDEGRSYAAKNACPEKTVGGYVDWLAKTYPFRVKRDPIPSWKRRAARLRATKNPHSVLSTYQSFMDETAELRDALLSSAGSAEAEIDRLIDERRGR